MQRFYSGWCNVSSFRLLKWMPAKNFLRYLWWFFCRFLQQVYQCIAIRAVQSIGVLSAWYRDFPNLLTKLNPRLVVDFYHFINTTQCWLSLTCNEMRSDSKTIDFVTLRKYTYFCYDIYLLLIHLRFANLYSHLYLLV